MCFSKFAFAFSLNTRLAYRGYKRLSTAGVCKQNYAIDIHHKKTNKA